MKQEKYLPVLGVMNKFHLINQSMNFASTVVLYLKTSLYYDIGY